MAAAVASSSEIESHIYGGSQSLHPEVTSAYTGNGFVTRPYSGNGFVTRPYSSGGFVTSLGNQGREIFSGQQTLSAASSGQQQSAYLSGQASGLQGISAASLGHQTSGLQGISAASLGHQTSGLQGISVSSLGHQTTGLQGISGASFGHQTTGLQGFHSASFGHQTSGLQAISAAKQAIIVAQSQLDQQIEFERQKSVNYELTSMGSSYIASHNEEELPKQYETRWKVFEKVPEMKVEEETRYKPKVSWETRLVPEPKAVIHYDEVEHIELVAEVKYITKSKPEVYYHVLEEESEVPVMEQVLAYEEVSVTRQEPRFVAEDIEEIIRVPVVREVPVTRMKKVFTGKHSDKLIEEYEDPGNFTDAIANSPHRQMSGVNSPSFSHASYDDNDSRHSKLEATTKMNPLPSIIP